MQPPMLAKQFSSYEFSLKNVSDKNVALGLSENLVYGFHLRPMSNYIYQCVNEASGDVEVTICLETVALQ